MYFFLLYTFLIHLLIHFSVCMKIILNNLTQNEHRTFKEMITWKWSLNVAHEKMWFAVVNFYEAKRTVGEKTQLSYAYYVRGCKALEQFKRSIEPIKSDLGVCYRVKGRPHVTDVDRYVLLEACNNYKRILLLKRLIVN